MELFQSILIVIIILLLPRVLLVLCAKNKILDTLGAVFLSYAAGILLSFVFKEKNIATTLSEIMVPIAIPLILFGSDIKALKKLSASTLKSFLLVMVSAVAAACAGFFIFRGSVENAGKISGMLVGLYTGGTPNLMAIGMALGVSATDIGIANTADLISGGIYFFLLLSVIPSAVRKILRPFDYSLINGENTEGEEELKKEFVPQTHSFSIKRLLGRIPLVLLAVGCLGIAAGIALLVSGKLDVAIVMLTVTTLGIAFSFVPKIRNAPFTFSSGQYFIYMFSLAIGISFDITALDSSAFTLLAMFFTVQLLTAIIHLVLARLTNIDADTMIITSTAGIYGPAFIVPVANALKNKEVILPGLICGILGYAAGNYLGIGVAMLLGTLV